MMHGVPGAEVSNLTPYGWNTDGFNWYLNVGLTNGRMAVADIPAAGSDHPCVEGEEVDVMDWIGSLAANPNLAWWYLAE